MMEKIRRILALSSCIAVACAGMSMSAGCETAGGDHPDPSQVAIEIRFQDGDGPPPQGSSHVLRLVDAAPGPITHDHVARVLVDISVVATGQPFYVNLELTKLSPDVWSVP